MSQQEIELKFSVAPNVAARLRRSRIVGKLSRGRSRTRQLHSVYFDTPDLRLFDNGVSLRVRRSGREIVQSVKALHADNGFARDEDETPLRSECPAPDRIADPKLKRTVLDAAAGSDLKPIFASDVQRTTRRLYANGSEIELAVDNAVIEAAGASNGAAPAGDAFCEIELELKSGHAADLLRVGLELSAAYPLVLSSLTKADRGFAAFADRLDAVSPVKRGHLVLEPDISVGAAYLRILNDCASHIQANLAAALNDDAEGIHQMRVALRRLRSAVDTFHPLIDTADLKTLARRARDLAAALSAARDYDVFLGDILAPLKAVVDVDAYRRFAAAIEEAQRSAQESVQQALAGPPFTRFVLDLALALEERPWLTRAPDDVLAAPMRERAAAILDKRLKCARKYGDRLERLDETERHELRKQLKKLRYTAEFFAPLYGRHLVKRYLKHLSDLQDVFGYLNDVAVADRLISDLMAKPCEPGVARDLAYVGGAVLGWHRSRLVEVWAGGRDLWHRLARDRPFWA